MITNPFAGLSPDDVAGHYDALRTCISGLHGIDVPADQAARQTTHDQLRTFGITPGAELTGALDLLSDLAASGDFDRLLKNTGVIEPGEAHPYQFILEDVSAIDASAQAISLLRTDTQDTYFCVTRDAASAPTAGMTLLSREGPQDAALHALEMHSLPSLRFWLFKFFVETDLGKSLLFSNYLEDADVAGFHAAATALYGEPATLGTGTALYWAQNVVIHVHGQSEPWVSLWVFDQTREWARNDALLAPIELDKARLETWAAEATAKS